MLKNIWYIPGEVWTKLPTAKSKPANNKIRSKINWSFTTHLTPARLITLSKITAKLAKPLTAQVETLMSISPAIDSPNPKTYSAQPTA